MKNTAIYLAAFLFFAAALGWLCYAAFTENSVYFLNVAEARANGLEKLGNARLFGRVAQGSIQKNTGAITFDLADKDFAEQIIPIDYTGQIPDAFQPGAEVIVEGAITPAGRFNATSLMTKCPSKYKKAGAS